MATHDPVSRSILELSQIRTDSSRLPLGLHLYALILGIVGLLISLSAFAGTGIGLAYAVHQITQIRAFSASAVGYVALALGLLSLCLAFLRTLLLRQEPPEHFPIADKEPELHSFTRAVMHALDLTVVPEIALSMEPDVHIHAPTKPRLTLGIPLLCAWNSRELAGALASAGTRCLLARKQPGLGLLIVQRDWLRAMSRGIPANVFNPLRLLSPADRLMRAALWALASALDGLSRPVQQAVAEIAKRQAVALAGTDGARTAAAVSVGFRQLIAEFPDRQVQGALPERIGQATKTVVGHIPEPPPVAGALSCEFPAADLLRDLPEWDNAATKALYKARLPAVPKRRPSKVKAVEIHDEEISRTHRVFCDYFGEAAMIGLVPIWSQSDFLPRRQEAGLVARTWQNHQATMDDAGCELRTLTEGKSLDLVVAACRDHESQEHAAWQRFLTSAKGRLACALVLLDTREDVEEERRRESQYLRVVTVRLAAGVQIANRLADTAKIKPESQKRGQRLRTEVGRILEQAYSELNELPNPYSADATDATVGQYCFPVGLPEKNTPEELSAASSLFIRRVNALYFRIVGRLVELMEYSEAGITPTQVEVRDDSVYELDLK